MNSMKNNHTTAWKKEYAKKGIPSSFRRDPARVVVEFLSKIENDGDHAADLGCGKGRNSLYLALEGYQVTAIDLLQENANFVNTIAKDENLPIQAYGQDLSTPWPIQDNSLEIAIDIFCYKHIVDKEGQKRYRNELFRTLKSGGIYFISLASDKDGFYGPLLKESPAPNKKMIIDPYSEIPSLLYTKEEVVEEFSDQFNLIEAETQYSKSPMHGQSYHREVMNFIFKKRK